MQVKTIKIDKAEVRQALRKLRSANFNFPGHVRLQRTYRRSQISLDERGIGTDVSDRETTHFG